MDAPPKPKIRVRLKPKSPPTDPESFQRAVEEVLRKKVREAVTANLTGGLLVCGAAVFAAVVTYWMAFSFLSFTTGWLFTMPYWLKRLLSAGLVVGLYAIHARTNIEELAELKIETRDGRPPFAIMYAPFGLLTNVALFHPETMRSFVRLVAAVLLVSPQLMWAGWRDLQRAARLRQLDIAGCATILGMMLGKSKKVSFEEILSAFPHLDLAGLTAQLLDVDGVVLLREEPQGLTLTADLRQDFLTGLGFEV